MKNRTKYHNLSCLKDIEYEKQFIRYKLAKKERRIERNWDHIYDTWNFVSIIARGVSSIAEYIPIGISAFSFLSGLFGRKTKPRQKE